jgi:hypothetical protein
MKRSLLIVVIVIGCYSSRQDNGMGKPIGNQFVLEWNNVAYKIAYEHDQFYSFIGIRTLCMTQLAIHDALNAIDPQYEQYAYFQHNPDADPIAAASTAAFDVLENAYPMRIDTISNILNRWLNDIEPGDAKEKGIELGHQAANAIINLREGDGHQKQGDYTPMTKPGAYQYTPGWDNWVLKPDFNYAKPFARDTVTQFRSPTPPDLTSEEYAQSFNEVKAYGMKNSSVRSNDQTAFAHWWAEFGEHSWNRIARLTASEKKLSAWEAARMFAMINMDIYDIYLASLESKYYYDTWRPYTAIRTQVDDGNSQTTSDDFGNLKCLHHRGRNTPRHMQPLELVEQKY